jgi:hypothetical protein
MRIAAKFTVNFFKILAQGSGHIGRLDLDELANFVLIAPGKEARDGTVTGSPCIFFAWSPERGEPQQERTSPDPECFLLSNWAQIKQIAASIIVRSRRERAIGTMFRPRCHRGGKESFWDLLSWQVSAFSRKGGGRRMASRRCRGRGARCVGLDQEEQATTGKVQPQAETNTLPSE